MKCVYNIILMSLFANSNLCASSGSESLIGCQTLYILPCWVLDYYFLKLISILQLYSGKLLFGKRLLSFVRCIQSSLVFALHYWGKTFPSLLPNAQRIMNFPIWSVETGTISSHVSILSPCPFNSFDGSFFSLG